MRDECVVCLVETLTFTRECCNAYVCDTCMSQYVTSKITSGVWMVVCPGEECDEKLEEGELLALLHQPETRKLYQRLKVDSNAVPNTKTCPNCKHITNVPAHLTTTEKYQKHGFTITCTNCAFDWCFQCHSPAHPDTTCVIRSETPFQEWAGDTLYGEFSNAVQCPQCKTYVQHDGGCNNMKCLVCGKEFCYLCGDKTCIHEGYIFGRHHPLTMSFTSLNDLDETLTDLERRYIQRLRRRPLAAGPTLQIPSLTCTNFCYVWAKSVLNWMGYPVRRVEARSAKAAKVCLVFMCIVMGLLLLLFPISIPVTMLIVLSCPRCRSRLYIEHGLEHRLHPLRGRPTLQLSRYDDGSISDDDVSYSSYIEHGLEHRMHPFRGLGGHTLQLRRYTDGSISDGDVPYVSPFSHSRIQRDLRDGSPTSSPTLPSHPRLTDWEPAKLYIPPVGLRGITAPPSPPSPYPHLTIQRPVSTRTASSPRARFVIGDDGTISRFTSGSSSGDQSAIALSRMPIPTNVTPGTDLSSLDSDSPEDVFLNVDEAAEISDEMSDETSTHSSRSVSNTSRLESPGKESDSSSSSSICSLMSSATRHGSAVFCYDNEISSDS